MSDYYCLKCHKKLSKSRVKNGHRLCKSCNQINSFYSASYIGIYKCRLPETFLQELDSTDVFSWEEGL